MNTIIIVLTFILCFLLGIELEQILTRRFLDKITEDTVKLSEENIGLLIEKMKLKDRLHSQIDKTLRAEKKILDLSKRLPKTEKKKDEIIRLYKIWTDINLIAEYVWTSWRTIYYALKRWGVSRDRSKKK